MPGRQLGKMTLPSDTHLGTTSHPGAPFGRLPGTGLRADLLEHLFFPSLLSPALLSLFCQAYCKLGIKSASSRETWLTWLKQGRALVFQVREVTVGLEVAQLPSDAIRQVPDPCCQSILPSCSVGYLHAAWLHRSPLHSRQIKIARASLESPPPPADCSLCRIGENWVTWSPLSFREAGKAAFHFYFQAGKGVGGCQLVLGETNSTC